MTEANLTEGKRLAGELPALSTDALDAAWEADKKASTAALIAALGTFKKSQEELYKKLLGALKKNPQFKARGTQAKKPFDPKTLVNYQAMAADLNRLTEIACAQVTAYRAAIDKEGLSGQATPEQVQQAMDKNGPRLVAQAWWDQLAKSAETELAALLDAIKTAGGVKPSQPESGQKKLSPNQPPPDPGVPGTAYDFRELVAAADKELTRIAKELRRRRESLEDTFRTEWPGKRNEFMLKLLIPEAAFTKEDLDRASYCFPIWRKAVQDSAAEREKLSKEAAAVVLEHAGGKDVSAQPVDQLEAMIACVADKLKAKTARAVRKQLGEKDRIFRPRYGKRRSRRS